MFGARLFAPLLPRSSGVLGSPKMVRSNTSTTPAKKTLLGHCRLQDAHQTSEHVAVLSWLVLAPSWDPKVDVRGRRCLLILEKLQVWKSNNIFIFLSTNVPSFVIWRNIPQYILALTLSLGGNVDCVSCGMEWLQSVWRHSSFARGERDFSAAGVDGFLVSTISFCKWFVQKCKTL